MNRVVKECSNCTVACLQSVKSVAQVLVVVTDKCHMQFEILKFCLQNSVDSVQQRGTVHFLSHSLGTPTSDATGSIHISQMQQCISARLAARTVKFCRNSEFFDKL